MSSVTEPGRRSRQRQRGPRLESPVARLRMHAHRWLVLVAACAYGTPYGGYPGYGHRHGGGYYHGRGHYGYTHRSGYRHGYRGHCGYGHRYGYRH